MIVEHTSDKEKVYATKGSRIAIYETVADAEADKDNIPDNTIVYTKDGDPIEVEWGEVQDVKSAITTSASTSWKVPKDGMVVAGPGSSSGNWYTSLSILRNGVTMLGGWASQSDNDWGSSFAFPVKKGDIVYSVGLVHNPRYCLYTPFKMSNVDYNQLEFIWDDDIDITNAITTSASTSWKAPKDGLFTQNWVSGSFYRTWYRVRNGVTTTYGGSSGTGNMGNTVTFAVKKGDIVYSSSTGMSCRFTGITTSKKTNFYKTYTGSQSSYVTNTSWSTYTSTFSEPLPAGWYHIRCCIVLGSSNSYGAFVRPSWDSDKKLFLYNPGLTPSSYGNITSMFDCGYKYIEEGTTELSASSCTTNSSGGYAFYFEATKVA